MARGPANSPEHSRAPYYVGARQTARVAVIAGCSESITRISEGPCFRPPPRAIRSSQRGVRRNSASLGVVLSCRNPSSSATAGDGGLAPSYDRLEDQRSAVEWTS